MKKQRQEKIKEIIASYRITTQEELIKKLTESGFTATQATMSRDIRELKLTKISDGVNGYYYTLPVSQAKDKARQLNHSLIHLIDTIDNAMNIIVIKTKTGMANAVATGIDSIKSDDILGCVAGDDTIFIVTRSTDAAEALNNKIKIMMTEE